MEGSIDISFMESRSLLTSACSLKNFLISKNSPKREAPDPTAALVRTFLKPP